MHSPDSLIDGRYRVGRSLGTGGACDVVLAEDLRLGRRVAIKIARPGSGWDFDGGFGDPQREAFLAASLMHTNIVAIFDSGRHEDLPYVVMEYVPGQSLREYLDASGPLPEADGIILGTEIGAALAAAHARGILHNDIKPANILLHPSGAAKLTDFGIGGRFAATVTAAEARELLGTMTYLAPEVLGGEPPTPASDGYSLALTVYEAIAGRLPFPNSTVVAAAQAARGELPRLDSIREDVSPAVSNVLARQLRHWPEGRYRSLDEFVAALKSAHRVHDTRRLGPLPSRPAAVESRQAGTGRNRRVIAALVAVAGVAGVGSVLGLSAINGSNGGQDPGVNDTNGSRKGTTVPVVIEATATNTSTPTRTPTLKPGQKPTQAPKETNTPQPRNTPKPANTPKPNFQEEDGSWWKSWTDWLPWP